MAPVTSRRSRPYQRRFRSSSSLRTVLEVTTKPRPSLPPDLVMLWLTMPIISPVAVNMGPPELPVLMGAVVWKNSASGKSRVTVSASQRALMMPELSEWRQPVRRPDDEDRVSHANGLGVGELRHHRIGGAPPRPG